MVEAWPLAVACYGELPYTLSCSPLLRCGPSQAKLELPPFGEALQGCGCGVFLRLVQQHWPRLGLGPDPRGRTIFAPDDASFLGDVTNWEEECWGLHIIEVHNQCPRGLRVNTPVKFVSVESSFRADGALWPASQVPLLIGDLRNYPGGRVQPVDAHPKHALRIRTDIDGNPSIWVRASTLQARKTLQPESLCVYFFSWRLIV